MAAPGSRFPQLTLRDETGSPLAPLSGETLYVVLKTTCPTCEFAWPFVERLRKAAEGGSLGILAVSQDDPEKTTAFQRRLGARVNTAYDPEPWRASDTLGVTHVPTFIRVGRNGSIEESAVGFDRDRMESFARRASVLAGRPYAKLFHEDEEVPAIRPG